MCGSSVIVMHSTECIYHVVPDPCMCWASRENANNNVVHFKLTALWHELLIKASHYSLAQTSHYTPEIAFVHYHTSYEANTQDLIYHRKVRGRKHVTKSTINIV